jgi:hypothetical protein
MSLVAARKCESRDVSFSPVTKHRRKLGEHSVTCCDYPAIDTLRHWQILVVLATPAD